MLFSILTFGIIAIYKEKAIIVQVETSALNQGVWGKGKISYVCQFFEMPTGIKTF